MHSSFWWGYKIGDFLFYGFTVNTVGGLIGLCFIASSLAFLFEWLKYLQAKHKQKQLILRSQQLRTICPSESSNLLNSSLVESPSNLLNVTLLDLLLLYGTEISLWFILLIMGYTLMLTVMLYNNWVFISTIFGTGLGYFIFGHMFMKINLQNCKIIKDTYCMKDCGEPEVSTASNRDGESTPALENHMSCHRQITTVSVHAECES